MNRSRYKYLLVAIALIAGMAWAEPSIIPTGVTIYDPTQAYNCYVLFSGGDNHTHLIDMDGHEVRRWKEKGFPSVALNPALVGGHKGYVLLQTSELKEGSTAKLPGVMSKLSARTIGEVDWNDHVVWEWGTQAPGGAVLQHHDLRKLPNGDTLILYNRLTHLPGFKKPYQLDDAIEEVTPAGKVVWNWELGNHLNELGFTPAELAMVKASDDADYLHINDMAPLGPNKWYAAGDKRFAPDNILINSRNANVMVIIDRATGHVVWRLGPDYPPLIVGPGWRPDTLPRPVDQMSGDHDAHMIPKGLPGAGDLLVFDNQGPAGFPEVQLAVPLGSRVLEINPVKKEVVWDYTAAKSHQPPWGFSASFISSARRLPNGNTLIDEGPYGRIFQVTPAGKIVWEYVSPYKGEMVVQAGAISNWIYRAQPVPYDWVPAGTPHAEIPVTPPGDHK